MGTPDTGIHIRLQRRWPFVVVRVGPNWLSLRPLPGEDNADYLDRMNVFVWLFGAALFVVLVLCVVVTAVGRLM